MKVDRLALAAALCLAAAPGALLAQQDTTMVTVTLEEAIARAYEHNPSFVQAERAIRTAAAAERSTVGSYLPSLSFNAGSSLSSTERYNADTNTAVTGSNDSYSAGLSASMDVFTAGRRGAERRQARAQTTVAEAQLVASRYDVAFVVEQAYYEEIRARELAEVAAARVERAQRGLEAAERRFQVGSATRSDVLRATLEMNTAREAVLQARAQSRNAAFALGRLIGVEGPVGAETPDGAPRPLTLADEEILELLTSRAPAIEAAQAEVSAADASVSVARTQYMPTVRLSSGYDWFNQDPALVDGRTSWSVRLGLSYPIFDGFRREESMERVRVQERVAETRLADTRRAVRADAERALGELRLADERITLAEEAVSVAEEDLRVQQERYALGASTILDLLTSQTSVVEAQNNLVSARFDYRLARAQLESLAGRDL